MNSAPPLRYLRDTNKINSKLTFKIDKNNLWEVYFSKDIFVSLNIHGKTTKICNIFDIEDLNGASLYMKDGIKKCSKCDIYIESEKDTCDSCEFLLDMKFKKWHHNVCIICRKEFPKILTGADILFFGCLYVEGASHRKCFYNLPTIEKNFLCGPSCRDHCKMDLFKECPFHKNNYIGFKIKRGGYDRHIEITHYNIVETSDDPEDYEDYWIDLKNKATNN